jgi:hypothetical protein
MAYRRLADAPVPQTPRVFFILYLNTRSSRTSDRNEQRRSQYARLNSAPEKVVQSNAYLKHRTLDKEISDVQ